MQTKSSVLKQIQGKREITWETDYEFLYQLQLGLLMALREQGSLTEISYRQVQEALMQQRREHWRKKRQGV